MRLTIILISILFSLLAKATEVDVCHYFSNIKTDPALLYQFIKDMPKGGELHYHLAGGALPEAMLSLAPQGNYCMDVKTYTVNNSNTKCHGISLNTLKKNSPLYTKTLRAWSMQDFTPNKESGHDHFFAAFFKFFPIVSDYSPNLLAEVMKRAARHHELYLEIMVLPDNARSASFGRLIENTGGMANKQKKLLANPEFRNNIQYTITESSLLLKKARKKLGCDALNQVPACALTIKFQYNILREQPLDNLFAQALNAFGAAAESNEIVGINLVQAEDGPISLHDYHRQMIIINFLHQAYPKVHIALHAGELTKGKLGLTTVDPKELSYHIHDAVFIGHAERIGHGVDIHYEDNAINLLDYMSKTSIPVEISFTSNRRILNISGKQHQIQFYLAHHVPIVLSTDDEGILRTNLTHEYVEAVTQYGLDYSAIKTINRNALTYSFLPGKSLWKNASQGIRISECSNLHTATCHTFISHSQKAALQWKLENQLAIFESTHCTG